MIDRLREHAHWVLLGIAGIGLVVHSLQYDFVTDDAYISFVYSRNLAEHGELSFNLGDPVEGYTNFLWTVILGLLMLVGASPEITSRVLGTVCALVTLWLVVRIVERALGRHSPWAGVAPMFLAGSSGFACWSSGGLETQLFTMLVTGALEAVVAATQTPRALRRAGWLLALAAMTRPEGPLIALLFGAAWIAHRVVARTRAMRMTIEHELATSIWFLALWAPWFAWRWWYYGHPFPNTYYVKASGPWSDDAFPGQMIGHGFYYIRVWLEQTGALYVLPLAVFGLSARRRSPRFVLVLACALTLVVYSAYAISVGGDFMGLHRFIMPLFVLVAIAVVLGLERLTTSLSPATFPSWLVVATLAFGAALWVVTTAKLRQPILVASAAGGAVAIAFWLVHVSWPRAVIGTIGVAMLGVFIHAQVLLTARSLDPKNTRADRDIIDTPAFLIVYTEDRAKIGRAMESCFRPDDFSIVGGAGAQPYFARMRGIDVFGLVSSKIAHESPRTRARAGHTKWGSEDLLASYDPTFVFSCYEIHRTAAQPQLGCATYWRRKGFELVTMKIEGLEQRGEYYTFLVKKTRNFRCPGRVR